MESSKDKKKNIIIICAILFVILLIAVFLIVNGNKTYTVTFNDGYSKNQVEVKNNHTVERPSDPTKTGYKFIGWYKDGIKFDFSTKIDKNVTLKAMFEKDSKKDSKKEITTTTVTTTIEETTTNKNVTTKKNVTTAKRTNAPVNTTKYVAPTTTTTTKYVAPTTTTTKKVVTYSYKWVDVDGSSAGQSILYVINNDTGKPVDGYVTITHLNGGTEEKKIEASGLQVSRKTFKSVSNPRGL